ncbi:hypothetical protein [Flavobacterium hydrophilum]|uniref:Uncharacterized protein n=1 Tax=Flavobacterium hydrophilum TaxID=2211445 RepID=A0A2V4BWP5_9FLAO|nr:hypothetical protein [Flavobacterium hydrophilum]PXY43042.1 hypothetical protein DMB68_21835 [Flavobacterium hydrophilum]
MRKIFIFLSILSIIWKSNGQNISPYYDAKFIKENCYDEMDNLLNNKTTLVAILKKYYPNKNVETDLLAIIKANPFLKQYAPSGFSSSPTPLLNNNFSFSSIGSTNVTRFADGLAKFIVERTKKELQAAFFDKFIEEVNSPEYKDIRTLFPTTYLVIKRLPTDVYNYEPYIEQLREAFGNDLEIILPHLEDVLNNGYYASFFNNHLELKSICLTALYFGNGLKNGKHIGLLIEEYNTTNAKYKFTNDNINDIKNNAILFIQEVSQSLKTNVSGSKEYWVEADEIEQMINDPVTFNLYLGLLYERINTIEISNSSQLTYGGLLLKGDETKAFIENLVRQIKNAQTQLANIHTKQANNDKVTIEDYILSFDAATRVIVIFRENQLIKDFINSIANPSEREQIIKFWNYYDTIIEGTNATYSIYTGIQQKKYNLVLSNVRILYQLRYDPEVLNTNDTKKNIHKIIDFLIEKGAFIAGIAEAKNSDEVYNAIDKIAMPVGSSRVKRLTKTNVAINAYCGFFVGNENIKDVDEDGTLINSYGLTAPVGFSFSKGNRILPWPIHNLIPETKGWSSTLFFSVIDLGAVASYRFTNETADQVPTIELKDIFSPGLFWSVGIPKTPISLNLGAQVGPNLRKVNDTTNDYSKNTYLRYSFSICVDIPLLNLYTKSK